MKISLTQALIINIVTMEPKVYPKYEFAATLMPLGKSVTYIYILHGFKSMPLQISAKVFFLFSKLGHYRV